MIYTAVSENQNNSGNVNSSLACFCHHKCASQYVRGVFQTVGRLLGLTFQSVYVDNSLLSLAESENRKLLRVKGQNSEEPTADLLYFGNGTAVAVELLAARGEYRGLHVIRDPRDILVSAYFSHRYSHSIRDSWGERLLEHRQRLAAAPSVEAGLLLELDFSQGNFQHIADWNYDNPKVYETRYESLIINPAAVFSEAFRFLGLKVPGWGISSLFGIAVDASIRKLFGRAMSRRACLPQPILRYVLARHAFQRRAGGRRPGQENVQHHYRKGIAGDWRNHFTPRVTAAFKERYGNMLIDLAYESSCDW